MAEGTSKLNNSVFENKAARQTTFFAYNWPKNATVLPDLLVRSGFYYQGNDQDVTCFCCGLTTSVKDWTRNVYPQQMHLKLSPECHFIQSKHAKGRSQTFNVVSHDSCSDVVSHDSCSDVVSHDSCSDVVSHDSCSDVVSHYSCSDIVSHDSCSDFVSHDIHSCIVTDITESSIFSDSGPPGECLLISGNTPFRFQTSQSHGYSYLPGSFLSTNAKAVSDGTSTTASIQSSFANAEFQSAIARPENLNYKHPEMETVTKRIDTFVTWPHKHIQEPGTLVSAGFYYTMDHDIVRCLSCNLVLSDWDENDNLWAEHARHSPNCWYLKRVKGQNFIDDIQKDWRKIYNPKFPNLIEEEDRIKTFNNWHNCIFKPPSIDIAKAGFFYTGRDGGLQHWGKGDNPWEQHAYYFPFCKFVIKRKGRQFISDIRERFIASAPNIDALMGESEEAEEEQYADVKYLLVISNKLETIAELRDKLAKLEQKYKKVSEKFTELGDTQEGSLTSQIQLTRSIEQLEAEKKDLTVLLMKKNKELDQLHVQMQELNLRLSYLTDSNDEHLKLIKFLMQENKNLRDTIYQRKKESQLTD